MTLLTVTEQTFMVFDAFRISKTNRIPRHLFGYRNLADPLAKSRWRMELQIPERTQNFTRYGLSANAVLRPTIGKQETLSSSSLAQLCLLIMCFFSYTSYREGPVFCTPHQLISKTTSGILKKALPGMCALKIVHSNQPRE